MKYLKSTLADMHQVFDRGVTIRYLTESLASFDVEVGVDKVRTFMEEKEFDVVGVRQSGKVIGYVNKVDLNDGTLEMYVKQIEEHLLLEDTTSILAAFQRLRDSPRIFVVLLGEVAGIITKGDLQKAPVRMWLFGLISLLEMHLLRLIREAFPNDTWRSSLNEKRVNSAQTLLEQRRQANSNIDLADCLQFADKKEIVCKSDQLRKHLNLPSKTKAEDILDELKDLRDVLAHGQDIVTGRWPRLVELAEEAERLLAACEMPFTITR